MFRFFFWLVFLCSLFAKTNALASCGHLFTGSTPIPVLETGAPQYIEMRHLHPSQVRFSRLRVDAKIGKALWKHHASYEDGLWHLNHADGRSVMPIQKAIPVVRSRFGYVVIDGHHDVLKSIAVGASLVPVKVVEDLSHLERSEFWRVATERGWTHLRTVDGELRNEPPNSFEAMENDPNRYLATLISRRFPSDSLKLSQSKGANFPVWIKIGEGRPFIEFEIADALRDAGIVYEESWRHRPPDETIERMRTILLGSSIDGLILVPEKTHFRKLSTFLESLTDPE